MWYECLPPFIIISVAIYIPTLFTKNLHTLMFGNPYKRDMCNAFARTMFKRDERLGGAAWNTLGLDNLPDD